MIMFILKFVLPSHQELIIYSREGTLDQTMPTKVKAVTAHALPLITNW